VALGKALRELMGNRRFCYEDELTREVLLEYLKKETQGRKRQRGESGSATLGSSSLALIEQQPKGANGKDQSAAQEDDLTRDQLLRYVKQKQGFRDVTLVAVTVQTMSGKSFEEKVEKDSLMRQLKQVIADKHGIKVADQHYFLLEGTEDQTQRHTSSLADTERIEDSCTIALCVEGGKTKCENRFENIHSFLHCSCVCSQYALRPYR
jgi:hypothetical protein